MKRRLVVALLIALCMMGSLPAFAMIAPPESPPLPAKAAIAFPDTYTLNRVTFYQGVMDSTDQLCIVDFTVEYGTPPAEDIDETILIRLLDSTGAEVGAVAPYAYTSAPDDGYSQGVVSFYLTSAEAVVWESAATIELVGNPGQTWAGGTPPKRTSGVDRWEDDPTKAAITARVIYLAGALEATWNVDMVESLAGVNKLTTTYGEPYFTTVIANLVTIAPDVFSAITTVPEFEERDYTHTESDATEGRWVGVAPFDLTDLAAVLGISRLWLTSFLFILASVVILILTLRIAESREPATFIFGSIMVYGAFSGWTTWEIGILCGLVGALALVYTFAWRGAA